MTVYENDKGTRWFVDEAWYFHSGYMIYREPKKRTAVSLGYFYHTEKEAQDVLDKMAQKKKWSRKEE